MIIVEGCTNFHSILEAKKIIRTAKEINPGGLVKFQLYNAEDDKGKPHYNWVKEHELTFEQAKELFDYGASIDQEVFFSVFDGVFVTWCEKIGVNHIKLSSLMYDLRVIKAVEESGIFYISSQQRKYFNPRNGDKFLYCPPGYPQREDANHHLQIWFDGRDLYDGFSDHSIGLDVSKIALARGAEIIEKHFVLEHDSLFPDNDWSMTPSDLKELVRWEKVVREVL
jgi:sialic acid synthase SpsE